MLKMGAILGKDYHPGPTAPILNMLISVNPNNAFIMARQLPLGPKIDGFASYYALAS